MSGTSETEHETFNGRRIRHIAFGATLALMASGGATAASLVAINELYGGPSQTTLYIIVGFVVYGLTLTVLYSGIRRLLEWRSTDPEVSPNGV